MKSQPFSPPHFVPPLQIAALHWASLKERGTSRPTGVLKNTAFAGHSRENKMTYVKATGPSEDLQPRWQVGQRVVFSSRHVPTVGTSSRSSLWIDLDGLAMGGEPYPDSTLNVEEVDTQIEVGALSVRRWNRWGHLRSSCKGDIVSGKVFFSTIHLPHE